MTKEFYEKEFKNGSLRDCEPVSLTLIGFIHKDYSKSEEDGKELDEFPTRAIYYVPNKLPLGDFGFSKWESGVNNLYLVDDGTSWDVCNDYFKISEIDNKTQWYDIPNNEKCD